MTAADGAEPAATAFIDLERPVEIDLSTALLWRVVVLHRGVPLAGFWLPSPGRLVDPQRFLAPHLRQARRAAAELDLGDRLTTRLGVRPLPAPSLTVSVVVCTHRRSAYLPGLLAALGRLDPAPLEVIVVDNDPGKKDSRVIVEEAGARYVREDARGLDNARNAGLRVARGDLVAYTDDDCLPPPQWLAGLPDRFASPAVAAVTGPAFAAELETPSQVRFELEGGFNRGFRRTAHDWTTISPLDAARVGVGANMAFRASALRDIAGGFPPELDTGTPARSAGDLYALYRLLRGNCRVVYDPAAWVLHRHRRDPAALREVLYSYGVGVSAAMTKALVEDREPAAFVTYSWLWRNFARASVRRLIGTVDAEAARCAYDYFRGSLIGAREWRRSLRIERRAGRAGRHPEHGSPPPRVTGPAVGAAADPVISVVVSTSGPREGLERCLVALATQTVPPERVDVVVADDTPDGGAVLPAWAAGWARIVRTGGAGPAVARSMGVAEARAAHLLLIEEDVVLQAACVAAHLAAARRLAGPGVVVGHTLPRPRRRTLVALLTALGRQSFLEEVARAPQLRFTDMTMLNVSLPVDVLRERGGFEAIPGAPAREGWLFGLSAMLAGVAVHHAPDAVAHHEFLLTTKHRLRQAREEGAGDAVLLRRHPGVLPALPGHEKATAGVALLRSVLARPRGLAAVASLLDVLERGRLRRLWLRLFWVAERAAYRSGRDGGGRRASAPAAAPAAAPLHADAAEPVRIPGPLCPPLELITAAGRVTVDVPLGRLTEPVVRAAASAATRAPATRPASRARPGSLEVLDPVVPHRRAGPASWASVDRAVARSSAAWVAVPLRPIADVEAFASALGDVVDGDRVAAYMGSATGAADPSVTLRCRRLHVERHPAPGPPPDYLVVAVGHHASLSGFRSELARYGTCAPALDFVERALELGMVVVDVDVPGAVPPRAPARAEFRRQRARGALLAGSGSGPATLRLVRGAVPIARMLRGPGHSWPTVGAAGLGYATGAVEGLWRPGAPVDGEPAASD